MNTWITNDSLGEIGFSTKKAALAAYPERTPIPVEFSMGHRGWLARNPGGTMNNADIKTPDGREIPIAWGWTPYGPIVGMRGGKCTNRMQNHWQAVMARVIEAGLEVHSYGKH
jgi:hypothetical protein